MHYPKLIVMLTHHDVTVPDSKRIFLESKNAHCDYWGFKDVGLPEDQMRDLVACMKDAGKTTFIESLAYTEEDGLKSVQLAADCGFDYVLGTHFSKSILDLTNAYDIKYLPFVGKRKEHRLYGEIDEIIAEAKQVLSYGTYGVNLPGFRYVGDAPALITSLVKSVDKPVSVVGSINNFERLDLIKTTNPWMFTIGGAFFEKNFGETFSEQIEVVIEYMKRKWHQENGIGRN
jgi:hypothetical protein